MRTFSAFISDFDSKLLISNLDALSELGIRLNWLGSYHLFLDFNTNQISDILELFGTYVHRGSVNSFDDQDLVPIGFIFNLKDLDGVKQIIKTFINQAKHGHQVILRKGQDDYIIETSFKLTDLL